MCDLSAPQFKDEALAREHLERLRWPNGPVCPHCGNEGGWKIASERRQGLYKCRAYACGEQFTVTVGTAFERSKIPLTKWLMAVHLMCTSKKGISSHRISLILSVTYKTAWFMTQRIRLAMSETGNGLTGPGGGMIEADEIHIGSKRADNNKSKRWQYGGGAQRLYAYLREFDFRCNHRVALEISDAECTMTALVGIGDERLLYRDSDHVIATRRAAFSR